MIWGGIGNGRCSFRQEHGVEVWEGEAGSRGLNGSSGQLMWSLVSHMKAFELCAPGRRGMRLGEQYTEIRLAG